MRNVFVLLFVCLTCLLTNAQESVANRWVLNPDQSISWKKGSGVLPHYDNIEMAGRKVATVVRYGINEKGGFYLNRGMVWPMLRTIPNNTHASLMRRFAEDPVSKVQVNGRALEGEQVQEISLNGLMTVVSEFPQSLELKRVLFPSVSLPAFCENYTLTNKGEGTVKVEIPSSESVIQTNPEEGVAGSYKLVFKQTGKTVVLKKGEEVNFSVSIAGYKSGEVETAINVAREQKLREALIAEFSANLVLETPDPVLNTMFRFAKIRASESIYETKGGLLHGPGGESYYAAIWANDQAEYVNPFFPFLGYPTGNESALNAYRHFARFMNKEYNKLPSSIIAEGDDTWGGAGDRGDAAMIAYGASRYALTRGDRQEAETLWPLIEWCLEYSHRQLNKEGVVKSDADELEGRFPAGKANLCTSSLYYDALISASHLGKEIGKSSSQMKTYLQQAAALRKSMDKYFAAKVEGFDTYQYYQGNDVLRSWICIPLTVGIDERKAGTIDALFSPRLWTKEGLLTQAGSETYWDRSTLYGFRGVLAAGETEKAMSYLTYYSNHRLLGEHVPYAIEAYPEGSQRHLSAESGLYCRIYTEGMFGIRPTGLRSFTVTPRLPKEWNEMALRHIRAFNGDFDVEVARKGSNLLVTVTNNGKKVLTKIAKEGTTLTVKL